MSRKLYQKIASELNIIRSYEVTHNEKHKMRAKNELENCIDKLPHGCGIDGKTVIDPERCKKDLIIIDSSYHYMNEVGFYDGWIDFEIWVRPTFFGIDVTAKGRFSDRGGKYADLKDYLSEVFTFALEEKI